MCTGIIFKQLLIRRRTRLTGLWLGLNSKPQPLRASRCTAHGATQTDVFITILRHLCNGRSNNSH